MPQINIGLVATKNKGLPVLFRTYEGNITDAEIKVAEILSSQIGNENPEGLEKEIRAAIRGVSDFFEINNDGKTVTVAPHAQNRRNARLRDDKCLLFTTNFEKSAPEIIATYFGKDVIEKIFDCFKNWLDLHPIRHFEEGNIDVYIFVCS